MDWGFLKFKKEGQDASAQKQESAKGAPERQPIEPPFFNVMPRAKVVTDTKKANTADSVPEPTMVRTAVQAPIVQSSFSKPTPILTSTTVSSGTSKTQKTPTPKAFQVIGAIIAILFACGAIVYAYNTLGSKTHIFDSFNNFLHSLPPLAKKQPSTSVAAPPETVVPPAAVPEYKTSIEWRQKYFNSVNCELCVDTADGDKDGLDNVGEFKVGSDPTKADSDGDGLADGDEVNVFDCSATNAHTAGNAEYTDADDLRGGWDCAPSASGDTLLTDARKKTIQTNASKFGFHAPTIATLNDKLLQYQSSTNQNTSIAFVLPEGVDPSPEAQLTRDVQRLNTIKKIGSALLQYKTEMKSLPIGTFTEMATKIKPFNTVATNTDDPINKAPFVYGYTIYAETNTFALTYASETQKQLIRYSEDQARADEAGEGMVTRDAQRLDDLDKIRSALLIYSAATANSGQSFVFPSKADYQSKIAPQYIQLVPKDPQSGADYVYEVAKDNASFTLSAVLEKPGPGTIGYRCTQEECKAY